MIIKPPRSLLCVSADVQMGAPQDIGLVYSNESLFSYHAALKPCTSQHGDVLLSRKNQGPSTSAFSYCASSPYRSAWCEA
jgi:hypothetical protein